MLDSIAPLIPDLEALYEDLHAHPELSFAEHRTAAIMAERLEALGYEVTTGVGGTAWSRPWPTATAPLSWYGPTSTRCR